jgi:ABC-2 type transport system permease protein
MNPEVALNNSIALLEYKFVNVIQKLESQEKPAVLFTAGHGELPAYETADLEKTLQEFYNTGRLILDSVVNIRPEVDVLVVAKPTQPFSEKDNFKIDQYIMNGGKVLWLLDRVAVDMDSLTTRREYFPKTYDLNLDNLLFKYGIRFKDNLVMDLQCSNIQLVVGFVGDAPQFDFFRYPYHLVISTGASSQHPIAKSLGPINLLFASTIDTVVETRLPIDKTILLASSNNSFFQRLPVGLDFNFLRYGLEKENFTKPAQPLAVLYEGEFDSYYANRVDPSMVASLEQLGQAFKPQSDRTSMLVVSDGDIARNDFDKRNQRVMPLGLNRNEMEGKGFLFSNKDFLVNAIEYLSDDRGLIEARSKDVKLRLLDAAAAKQQASFWQFFNIGLPLLFLALFGFTYNWWRKRRYAQQVGPHDE